MRLRFDSRWFVVMASSALLGACATPAEGPDRAGRADIAEDDPLPPATALWSDAELAGILSAANSGEIAQAQIAMTTATHPAVIQFAQMMITEHTKANQKVSELSAQLGVTPVDSPISLALQQEATTQTSTLQGLAQTDFDAAYIDAQIQAHGELLSQLDTQVIGMKQPSGLKSLLPEAHAMVARHLALATAIRQSLESPGPVSSP